MITEQKDEYRKRLYSQLEELYGKVVYTYTAHHKMKDRLISLRNRIKIVQVCLTAISACGFLATILKNNANFSWIGGIPSVISLALTLYSKDFDFFEEINIHKAAADDLWEIREAFSSLIIDFNIYSDIEIREKRDELQCKWADINRKYPGTDKKGYKAAQKAIQVEQEQTFNEGEVDKMLPIGIRTNK